MRPTSPRKVDHAVKGETLPESRPKGDMSAYGIIRPKE